MKYFFLIAQLLLGFFGLNGQAALAAGLYDGVYQNFSSSNDYLTIYQNGSTIITTNYTTYNSVGAVIPTVGGMVFPGAIDYFTVHNGTINGSTATISGIGSFRACNVTLTLNFYNQSASMVVATVTPNPLAISQNYNCLQAHPIGSTLYYNKIL